MLALSCAILMIGAKQRFCQGILIWFIDLYSACVF